MWFWCLSAALVVVSGGWYYRDRVRAMMDRISENFSKSVEYTPVESPDDAILDDSCKIELVEDTRVAAVPQPTTAVEEVVEVDPVEEHNRCTRVQHILREVVATESTYVECLSRALAGLRPLPSAKPHPLYTDVLTMHSVHDPLLRSLREAVPLTDPLVLRTSLEKLLAAFEERVHSLRLTIAYIQKYHSCHLRAGNAEDGVPAELDSLLITPIQRIPRYLLLFSELQKSFPRSPAFFPLQTRLSTLLQTIRDIALYCNEKQRDYENASSVMDLFQKLKLNEHFVPSRRFVLKAEGVDCVRISYPRRKSTAMDPASSSATKIVHRPPLHTASFRKQKKRDMILFSDLLVFGRLSKRSVDHAFWLARFVDDYFEAYPLQESSTTDSALVANSLVSHSSSDSLSSLLPSSSPNSPVSQTGSQTGSVKSSISEHVSVDPALNKAFGFIVGNKQDAFCVWLHSHDELKAWIAAIQQSFDNVCLISSRIAKKHKSS